jgi:LPXTG-motif cell wall-anchored protein
MNKTLVVAAVALLGLAVVGSASPENAGATPSDKVTICHATSSEKNPYRSIPVNTSSIDEINNRHRNGHGDHTGDIIPSFTSPIGTVFPGLNWDAVGQAIWNNGCVVPPLPVEVVVVAPTMTDPTCDAPGVVVVPEVVGLVYVELVVDGSVTVSVKAADGFVLADGSATSWTFPAEDLAQLDPDDPRCTSSEPLPVTVVAPTMTDPTCDAPGVVVVPEVVGLVYVELVVDGSVTVSVKAADGFVLADGSATSWTFPAEDLAQLDPNDPRCVASEPPVLPEIPPTEVLPPEVVPPEVSAQGPVPPAVVETPAAAAPTVAAAPTALPATGSSSWLIFLVGLASMLTGVGLVGLSRRTA